MQRFAVVKVRALNEPALLPVFVLAAGVLGFSPGRECVL
jgi:hypothetical protein